MLQLLAIGDPIIDTHVQIDDSSAECRLIPHENMKLCFDYGSKIPIVNSFQALGGNAANVAVGATKLGLKTAVLSTIGDDINGKIALKALADAGVDTSYLTTDKKTTTRYSIILNYQSERTILSHSEKAAYVWPKPAPATDWIYYTGLSEGFETIQKELTTYLKAHPTVHLAVNPGSYLLKFNLPALKEILKLTDLLIVNLEEAEKILRTTLTREKSVGSIIRQLTKFGPKEIAITDAERGAWTGTKDTLFFHKAFPVKVVAKTGAGDAFSAGYITARYHGHDMEHALSWGIANSAATIQEHSSQKGLQTVAGLEKIMQQFSSIRPISL